MLPVGVRRVLRVAAWFLVVAGVSPVARSQVATQETAQTLFDEGRRLMEASRFAEACAKLAESQKLDPASGTLLNLAVCHELVGKTATAWREYRQVLADPLTADQRERQHLARERIAGIEPQLARVTFELPHPVPGGFWLFLDDVPLIATSLSEAIPVDPGPHRVRYGAPDRAERVSRFDTVTPGTTLSVRLAALDERRPVVAAPPGPPVAPERRQAPPASRSWLLPSASFAVAAGAFGATTYFGVRAIQRWTVRERHCTPRCDTAGSNADASAGRFARAADISLAVGIAATGVGAYFTWKTLRTKPPPVELNVSFDRRGATLGLSTPL
jgi:hypothetical protein